MIIDFHSLQKVPNESATRLPGLFSYGNMRRQGCYYYLSWEVIAKIMKSIIINPGFNRRLSAGFKKCNHFFKVVFRAHSARERN